LTQRTFANFSVEVKAVQEKQLSPVTIHTTIVFSLYLHILNLERNADTGKYIGIKVESVGENFDVNFVVKDFPADKQFTIW
jgi:hypothetical protein